MQESRITGADTEKSIFTDKMRQKSIQLHVKREKDRILSLRLAVEILLAALLAVSFWLMLYFGFRLGTGRDPWLTGGMPVLFNHFMQRLTAITWKIHLGMAVGESGWQAAFIPVMLAATAAAAWFAVRWRNPLFLIAFAGAGLAGVVSGVIPINLWSAGFIAVLITVAFYKYCSSAACVTNYRNAAVMTGAFVIAGAVLIGGMWAAGAGKAIDTAGLSSSAAEAIHKEKYEKYENPMPEGRIAEAGSFEPDDRSALQVSSFETGTLYLKGFVGEVYKDGIWTRISGEEAVKDSDLFYWLHDDGFYGQTQTASAYELTGTKADGFLSVTSVGACRNYCYMPYGMSMGKESILDPMDIGDLNIKVSDPDLSGDYVYTTVNGAVNDSRSLQKRLQKKPSGDNLELEHYLDDEETYRKACAERYLSIPNELENTLAKCLGKQETLPSGQAMARILDYLDRNVAYSQKSSGAGKGDPIVRFLSDTKKGYAIHYASAAVMMMRYYGVPARYVEGFIVPGSLLSEETRGTTVVVPMRYSHAWVEYYLDGVGWLPFETVPKYQDKGVSGQDDSGKGQEGQSQEEQQKENKTDNPLNRVGKIFAMNKLLIAGIALVMLLLFIVITLIRRRRLKEFLETFHGEDRNLAVENAFAYSLALLKAVGIDVNSSILRESLRESVMDEECRHQLAESMVINEEARFACREITGEQRDRVLEFRDTAFRIYKDNRNIFRIIIDRIVRCLY